MKNKHIPYGPYERFFKRPADFTLALLALLLLSPLLLLLTVIGTFAMRGNPFFAQERPGRDERIFRLVKFRTMTNAKDEKGDLLPDERRLNAYGRFLRSTSADELPSLWNILKGDLAIVGPRPLYVKYLPLYNEAQRHRHDVRTGLTGHAQVHGRNAISWEERFGLDLEYVNRITFWGDVKIVFLTVGKVLKREGIHSDTSATMEEFTGTPAAEVREKMHV